MDSDATIAPVEPAPSAQPSTLRNIFVGKDGLRAGWSLLIFIALIAACLYCARVINHKLHPHAATSSTNPSEMSLREAFLSESIPLLITLFVTWIMSKIERRPASVYGLGDARKLSHFLAGLAWGFVCLSLLVLTLWKTGLLVFESRLIFGGDVFRYGSI
jgi:hypothetical protein